MAFLISHFLSILHIQPLVSIISFNSCYFFFTSVDRKPPVIRPKHRHGHRLSLIQIPASCYVMFIELLLKMPAQKTPAHCSPILQSSWYKGHRWVILQVNTEGHLKIGWHLWTSQVTLQTDITQNIMNHTRTNKVTDESDSTNTVCRLQQLHGTKTSCYIIRGECNDEWYYPKNIIWHWHYYNSDKRNTKKKKKTLL